MQYENKKIFDFWTYKKDTVLYVNDRLDKQRIMFQICSMDSSKRVTSSADFYMDLPSVRHLIHKILYSPLNVKEEWNRIRVAQGRGRAITICKRPYNNGFNYSIKIDNGAGAYGVNGPTLTKKDIGLYIYLPMDTMESLCLELEDIMLDEKLKLLVNKYIK